MSISVRKAIQDSLKLYIETQTNIPVYNLRDNSDSRGEKGIYIDVLPEKVSEISYDWYEMDIELHAVTYITDDKQQIELNSIYNILFEIAMDLVSKRYSLLVPNVNLIAWGNEEAGQDNFPIDERFQASVIKLKVFAEPQILTT